MRKLILTGISGAFVLGMTSCGGHNLCDAYKTADYTKYKTDQSKKIVVSVNLKNRNK